MIKNSVVPLFILQIEGRFLIMKEFKIKPNIVMFDKAKEFCSEFKIGKGDLLFVSDSTYEKFFEGMTGEATVINYRKYGRGEPTDTMVEGIYHSVKDVCYKRVIAVGGGTILDIAKLFALKNVVPVDDLFDKKLEIIKDKELILVPTTCGTGSEVTNISILELIVKETKMGLAVDELYADKAVLIPELLRDLPFKFFATSSIDALIHSIESFTSPKANEFTKMFSKKAMKIILEGYKYIVKEGKEARKDIIKDMLIASTYAGIAFSNAGCAAVHAMSYPLGATYHVPHGEANYAIFTGVYKTYEKINPDGSIKELNVYLAQILGCKVDNVYDEIENLLNNILPKKALHKYNMQEEEIEIFTDVVMTKQGRLMANNYVPLSRSVVEGIYRKLY